MSPGQPNTGAPAPSARGKGRIRAERDGVQTLPEDRNTKHTPPTFATTSAAGTKRPAEDDGGSRDQGREAKRVRDGQALSNVPSRAQLQSSVCVPETAMQSIAAPSVVAQSTTIQTRGAVSGTQTAFAPPAARPAPQRVSQLARPARATNSTGHTSPPYSSLAVSATSHTSQGQAANPPLPSLRAIGFVNTGLNPHASKGEYKKFAPGMVVNFCPHMTAQDPNANPFRDKSFLQGRSAVISSKERPGVISNVFANGSIRIIICSTHSGDDLDKIDARVYYMVLRDRNDDHRPNRTDYGPLDVIMFNGRAMGRKSSICLTNEHTIQDNESVSIVGRLTDRSTEYLLDTAREVRNTALRQCEDRKREKERREAAAWRRELERREAEAEAQDRERRRNREWR